MISEEITIKRDDIQKIIKANNGITRGIDLSRRNLSGIDLSGLDLKGIDFSGSIFRSGTGSTVGPAANLDNANFEGCNVEGAIFAGSSMKSTNMEGTNARRTDFSSSDLTNANFHAAKLEGAKFNFSKLDKTNFNLASLDDAFFWEADLKTAFFEGAKWGDKYILGDEKESYVWAEQAYKALRLWHRASILDDIAGEFRYRELWSRRKTQNILFKSSIRNHSPRAIIGALSKVIPLTIADVLFGFGERWKRVILWWFIIFFAFALTYFIWATAVSPVFLGNSSIIENIIDSIYYSVASFTALGYGTWSPKPIGWAKYAGLAQAVLGPILIALFITTFTRIWSR